MPITVSNTSSPEDDFIIRVFHWSTRIDKSLQLQDPANTLDTELVCIVNALFLFRLLLQYDI
jgi:hypothetical protein